ncbi:Spy/CpxP family protein refolding chaperone [Maridesulfovibrio ferrireducens]|uniref:Spy/CpxP family protein refolding chaperone n=1 Tax=Maridesulfovibrio ferrireducens TaxID=246191 RepID=UPI001A2583B3|nr:periplasmic heavy metal sensor [Maridesulfovibrio ferrireducens]MBI9109723.1 periplasmic heavy metal sensor [Maridesulfovibrio ferrireducens]
MNKKTLIPLIIVFVLSMATIAMARGGSQNGYNNGGNRAAFNQLTPEKQQQAQAIMDKYTATFQTLQNQQWAKRTELNALVNSGKADKETIHALVKDLSDVREKMFTTHQKMAAELEKEIGITFPGPRNGSRGMMQGGNNGCGNNYQKNQNCGSPQGCPRFN